MTVGGESQTMTAFDSIRQLLDLFRHPEENRIGGKPKP